MPLITQRILNFRSRDDDGAKEIQPMLERFFDGYFGIWANQRIICVGDYAERSPPTLEDVQGPLYNHELTEIFSLRYHFYKVRKELNNEAQKTLEMIYQQLQIDNFPAHQQYVLVNFTAKEYVIDRFYNTPLGIGLAYQRESSIWSLGDVALSKICWTQDPSTSMKYSPNLEGEWAGHRFAIIALSVFDEMTGGREGWEDATDQAWEDLGEIWRAEDLR